MTLFFILVLISFTLLVIEFIYLRLCVNKIQLRILVNGTRGKSSVTKYIAAGLRAADKKTIAKITGIIPTIIYSDGTAKTIKRISAARVQEQFKIIRTASRLSMECLVLECMSITPELQKLESIIFKPHIYVITNIKDDHREQMGNLVEQVKAICNAIPSNSIVVADENRNDPLDKIFTEIQETARNKKSRLVRSDDVINLEGTALPDGVFEANIKIAAAVCKAAGVKNEKFKKAIIEEAKSSEGLVYEYSYNERIIRFINGFAVNDVSSAKDFLSCWQRKLNTFDNLNIIFNSRADRPLRSIDFARWFGSIQNLNKIIVTGSHTPRTKLELLRNGIESQKIITWSKRKINDVLKHLEELSEPDTTYFGFGNISGEGFLLINTLREQIKKRIVNDN